MSKNGQLEPIPPRIDKLIVQYIKLRDKKEEIEAAQKEYLKEYRQTLDKLEGELLEFLDSTGQKSAITVEGRVTVKVTPYASCSDPDLFVTYVRENDAYELMDRRANSTACKAYAEEHGELPPGVKLTQRRSIGVTRA